MQEHITITIVYLFLKIACSLHTVLTSFQMKKLLLIVLFFTSFFSYCQQRKTDRMTNRSIKNNPLKSLPGNGLMQVQTPDKIYGTLFKDIQLQKVLSDNKTFVDAVPKYSPAIILKRYAAQKNLSDFDLKDFVTNNLFFLFHPLLKYLKPIR